MAAHPRSNPYPEPGSAAEESPDRDPGRMSAIADARATLRRAALVGSREHVGTASGPASTRSEGLMTVQAFKVDDQSAQVKQSGRAVRPHFSQSAGRAPTAPHLMWRVHDRRRCCA